MCDVLQLSRQTARRDGAETGSGARRIICAVRVTPPRRKGGGTARLLGVQAAGCPASPSSSETRCLSASRLLIVVIDPMCKRSSTETNCVSPIDSARDCALRIPRDARSIASATFVCSCALGMAFAFCVRATRHSISP